MLAGHHQAGPGALKDKWAGEWAGEVRDLGVDSCTSGNGQDSQGQKEK